MFRASGTKYMNKQSPILSVVVPAFNAENYVDDFIKCITEQTYDNWELILVDDGSMDRTVELIHSYCLSDSRIKLFVRDRLPKGANSCRNLGKLNANGKYLIFFDIDDIVAPICFQQRVDYMENNPDVDYATFPGESIYYDENGKITYTGRIWGTDTKKDMLDSFLRADYPFAVWNNIYRVDEILEIIWDERLRIFQDFDFIVSTLIENKAHSYATQAQKDYFYRVGNPLSISSDFVTNEKIVSTIYLFNKTANRLKEKGYPIRYLSALDNFVLFFLERVSLSGNIDQIKTYTDFCCSMYKFERIRIKLFSYCVMHGLFKSPKYRRIYYNCILFPVRLIRFLSKKIFAHI